MAWLPAAEEPCGRRRPPASFSSQYSQLFYFFILDFFSLTLLLPPNTINTNNFFSLALPSPPNTFYELTRKRIWKQNCLVELFGTVLRPEICCGTKMVQFICYYMKYVGLIRFCIRYVVLWCAVMIWYVWQSRSSGSGVSSHSHRLAVDLVCTSSSSGAPANTQFLSGRKAELNVVSSPLELGPREWSKALAGAPVPKPIVKTRFKWTSVLWSQWAGKLAPVYSVSS